MSQSLITTQRKRVHAMGIWAGARYLRKQGFSLDEALLILFDRSPRHD